MNARGATTIVAVLAMGCALVPAAPATASTPAEATKAAQQVTIGWIPDLSVGQFAQVQADASSGLPTQVAVTGSCRLAGATTVVATRSGPCIVTATQEGDTSHAAATATSSFTYLPSSVDVAVHLVSGPEVVPGAALEARVRVAGLAGDEPAPSGAVEGSIVASSGAVVARVGAALDETGDAWLRVPPRTTESLPPGHYRLSVSYPGDGGYLASPGREVRFSVVRTAGDRRESSIELGAPLINRAQHAYRFAGTTPGRASFHAWSDSGLPVEAGFAGSCTGSVADGRVTVSFSEWGSCRVTLRAPGNAAYTASAPRTVVVSARRSGARSADRGPAGPMASGPSVGVVDKAGAGRAVVVGEPPDADPAAAPAVDVDEGTVITILVPGLVPAEGWSASIADGESATGAWTALGAAEALDGGGVLLPAITAASVGRYLIRLEGDADGQDPLYLLLEVDAVPVVDDGPLDLGSDQGDPSEPVWKWLLKSTLEGAMSQVGSSAAGWAIGMIFGAKDNKQEQQSEQILTKLEQISAQIDELKASINRLDTDVKLGSCKNDINNARQAITYIKTAMTQYQVLIAGRTKDAQNWRKWAEDATSQGPSAYAALVQMALFLSDGSSVGTGAITACSQYLYQDWRDKAAAGRQLGEGDYYGRLWEIVQYFYQYQVIALNIVVEANHVLATLAYKENNGTLPPADKIAKVCQASGPGQQDALGWDPRYYCGMAEQVARDVWNAMLDQALLAGAGFVQNPAARDAIQAQYGTTKVWVSSIGRFGAQDCPEPTDSDQEACGDSVGLDEPFTEAEGASLGYQGWGFANQEQWADMLRSRQHPGVYGFTLLELAGFAPDQNVIVYTGSIASGGSMYWPTIAELPDYFRQWRKLKNDDWKGRCLFDSGKVVQEGHYLPYCDGQYAHMNNLALRLIPSPTHAYPDRQLFRESKPVQSFSFYETKLSRNESIFDWYLEQPAGWMVGPNHPGTEQYRWPVLDVGDPKVYGCSAFTFAGRRYVNLGARNKAGALQMCSTDMEAFLKQLLPDPPAR